jgi:formylglycine-generating enzyme
MRAVFAALTCWITIASCAFGDTFGSGANTFTIDFVTIGNPGNAADATGNPNPAGDVAYSYRLGQFEVSEQMIDKANALGGLGITKDTRGPNKPATTVTWYEAARFANWLNTSSGNAPAYKFDAGGNFQLWGPLDLGYDPSNLYRNSLAKYFLPSVDEWYKAAFYNSLNGLYTNYPSGNSPPAPMFSGTLPGTAVFTDSMSTSRPTAPADINDAGGLSSYGVMAMAGNVWEWEETEFDLLNDLPTADRGNRGGSFLNFSENFLSVSYRRMGNPTAELINVGFRVASSVSANGDYNTDGRIDASDYVVWRKFVGSHAEYSTWRGHFGGGIGTASAVPEPASITLIVLAAACRGSRRRK